MDVYDRVQEHGISNAVVFLKTGCGGLPAANLTRNGITFAGSVIYALDRGKLNQEVMAHYRGRSAYTYSYDPAAKKGSLSPVPEPARQE